MNRIFLLSPADCGGQRAQMLTRPGAKFELAVKLQSGEATLGELFAFMSGLYFRGKLTYAKRFAVPPSNSPGVLVMTSNRGLLPIDTLITLTELQNFGKVDIDINEPLYHGPLTRDVRHLAETTGPDCEVVLLGSVATGKYVEVLEGWLKNRLMFPGEFVGRGDMSRGGLMLRSVNQGTELEYIPVNGAIRRGLASAQIGASPQAGAKSLISVGRF